MAVIVIVVAPTEEIVTIVRQLRLNAKQDAERDGKGEGGRQGGSGGGGRGEDKTNNAPLDIKNASLSAEAEDSVLTRL